MFRFFWDKKREQHQEKQSAAVGNFQVSAQLPNGRNASFSMYVLDGETLESINDKLDLCQDAIDRQRSRCEIPELEAKREQMIKGMNQAREVLAELEERQNGGGTLTSQERMNMKNMAVNIAKVKDEIDKGDEAIQVAKKVAGVR